jgi:asparaginyl-tRNA synthetase
VGHAPAVVGQGGVRRGPGRVGGGAGGGREERGAADTWEAFGTLTLETSVAVTGEVRADARAPGGHELSVRGLAVVGASPLDYPVQPKEHGVDFLLDHRHLWLRSPRQAAILRVRHEVEQAIHDFFYERDFVRCDTPILTAAIGERSGLFSTEYFDEGTAYLAQTGQLYGEALAAALGRIYTFGPTFRAEKSKTRRHLTEFWMIEPEMAWYDQDDNMDLQEAFVRYLVGRVLERRGEELEVLERDPARLACVAEPFVRLDYGDAVALVQQKGSETHWGEDLGAPDEKLIVDHYERPVFVVNYPKEAKAFYMKENPADPRTVRCADLLAPEGRGEIIGGSQREDDHDKLRGASRRRGCPWTRTAGTSTCGSTAPSRTRGSGSASSAPSPGSPAWSTSAR